MRLKIPMTGTVLEYDPKLAKLDGQGIKGDPNDIVRPIPLNLGNVSWQLISIDMENDLMEIEISVPEEVLEKQKILEDARLKVEGKSSAELYALTGSPKLRKLTE